MSDHMPGRKSEYVRIYARLPYMSEYMSGEKSEDMSKYLSEYIYII